MFKKSILLSLAVLAMTALAPEVKAQMKASVSSAESAKIEDAKDVKKLNVTLSEVPEISFFNELVNNAGLTRKLSKDAEYTIFAPVNKAFEALPERTRKNMQQSGNTISSDLVRYHIVKGNISLDQLQDGQFLATLSGDRLRVSKKDGEIKINGSPIKQGNITSANGLIHTIENIAVK